MANNNNNNITQDNELSPVLYQQTTDIVQDAKVIIESARNHAYQSVNTILVVRNWQLGHRIAEEELRGQQRADYGKQLIGNLAKQLTDTYGRGFDASNLYKFLEFYRTFPQILDTARLKFIRLTWSHYRTLLQEHDPEARIWYEQEAISQVWSQRTLQRNISSQYYQRTLLSQHSELVKSEMKQITSPLQEKLEFIKNPVIAEFLGIAPDTSYLESDLENAIITNQITRLPDYPIIINQ